MEVHQIGCRDENFPGSSEEDEHAALVGCYRARIEEGEESPEWVQAWVEELEQRNLDNGKNDGGS